MDLSDVSWNELDSGNNKAPPLGWPEGQLPDTVNDCARMMMGAHKRSWDRFNATVTTTGAAGVYTYATVNTSYPAAYVPGELYRFTAHQPSVGNDTFAINLLGALPIYRNPTTRIVAGDILGGMTPSLSYNPTFNAGAGGFLLQNPNIPLAPDNSGNVTFPGNVNTTGALAVTGNASVGGNETVTGTLAVTGATTLHAATATTPATADNSTAVATTAFVKNQGYATTSYVNGAFLPLSGGGTVNGSVTVTGNVIGNNSVQSGGVYFQNNSGYFYTPQSFLSGGNVVAQASVYAGGTGGVYFSNNGGWFYTPYSLQTNGNLQVNASSTVQGNEQVNGNFNCSNQVSSNTVVANGITSNGGLNTVNCNISNGLTVGSSGNIQIANNYVLPFADDWGQVGAPGKSWVAMESYAYYNASDPRLKQDIAQAPVGALDKVCAIPVIQYRWRSRPNEPLRTGFDASDVKQQFDSAVKVGDDERQTLSLNLMEMLAGLWQAVQELSIKVADLEAAR